MTIYLKISLKWVWFSLSLITALYTFIKWVFWGFHFFFKASPPSAPLHAAVFLPSIYLHAAEDCSGDAVSGNYLTQKINVEVCLNCYCIPNKFPAVLSPLIPRQKTLLLMGNFNLHINVSFCFPSRELPRWFCLDSYGNCLSTVHSFHTFSSSHLF